MAFPTTSVLDDFNRADGAVGGNWLAGFGDSLATISSNAARGSASGWRGMVWAPSGSAASFSAPQEGFVTVATMDTASAQSVGIVLRGTNITTGTYSAYVIWAVPSGIRIHRYIAGASTLLYSGGAITINNGDKFGAEVIGTSSPVTINAYHAPGGVWPGTPTATFSDSSTPLTTGGQLGLSWNQSGANSAAMDDFGGGTTGGGGGGSVLSSLLTVGPSYAAQRAASI